MADLDLDRLASELAEFDPPEKQGGRPALEELTIAGFEDIQRYAEQHGRVPEHGEEKDIFERIYAARLDRIRSVEEYRAIVMPLDHQGLINNSLSVSQSIESLDENEIMAELEGLDEPNGLTKLRYVRPSAQKREADEIANREKCSEFERFRSLFDRVNNDLATGARTSLPIHPEAGFLKSDIKAGEFFILFGQIIFVAEVGKKIRAPNGETDARLRVIYSNGTESNLLLRSLQRALYKDEASRKISDVTLGPLFNSEITNTDKASGTIYVLRSKSDIPAIADHRAVLHKIGVTGGDVSRRIANARLDPTFLMADVEIVATYELFNINRVKLENLIHRVFGNARLEIQVIDRFGQPVIPREWFLVPLSVIEEAIEKITVGDISDYTYDPEKAKLVYSSAPPLHW
jgi:hypothetical protein